LLSKAFFFAYRKVTSPRHPVGAAEGCDLLILLLRRYNQNRSANESRIQTMELPLETVALFALKLAYEREGESPILRDDPIMSDYEREVFGLLVRRGDVEGIQFRVAHCVGLALDAIGGADTPLGRELNRLAVDFSNARTMEQLNAPLIALKDYLKDIQ
jgi:hypothetical protein